MVNYGSAIDKAKIVWFVALVDHLPVDGGGSCCGSDGCGGDHDGDSCCCGK